MKFDKKHLVDIKTLTRIEAEEFLKFLGDERQRHIDAALRCSTKAVLWSSEAKRQVEEVRHIDEGIAEVNKKFGWGEK